MTTLILIIIIKNNTTKKGCMRAECRYTCTLEYTLAPSEQVTRKKKYLFFLSISPKIKMLGLFCLFVYLFIATCKDKKRESLISQDLNIWVHYNDFMTSLIKPLSLFTSHTHFRRCSLVNVDISEIWHSTMYSWDINVKLDIKNLIIWGKNILINVNVLANFDCCF